ncbi:MAG: hypothetical protein R2795_00595 [Saprospiraceae bacterium]
MKILHQQTGVLHEATIELVRDEDWEIIRQSGQFKFNWLLEKKRIVQKYGWPMNLKFRANFV